MYTITCVRSGLVKRHKKIKGIKCVAVDFKLNRVSRNPIFKRTFYTLDDMVLFITQSFPALFFPELKIELNNEEQRYVFSKLNSYLRNHSYEIRGIRRFGIEIIENGKHYNFNPVDKSMKPKLGIKI